jgi:hypothetical protein
VLPSAIKTVLKYANFTGLVHGFSKIDVRNLRPGVIRVLVEMLGAPYRAAMPAQDLALSLFLLVGLKNFPTSKLPPQFDPCALLLEAGAFSVRFCSL